MKYRVWNNATKRFLRTSTYIDSDGNLYKDNDPYGLDMSGKRSISPMPNCTVMRSIDLHDKNGTPIFEGDFFQRPVKINKSLHGEWTIYQFMIKNGNTIISYLRSEKDTGIPEGYMAALYTDELDIDMKTLMFAKEVTLHEVEILGNIHEHKHLLK